MPRELSERRSRRLAPVEPPIPSNTIIASAANLTQHRLRRNVSAGGSAMQEWQQQAWYFYDACSEFHYGVSWRSQAMSRVRLKITERTPDGDQDVTVGPEVDALNALFGGDAGQSQMMAMISLHFDVPGETYVVGEVVPTIDPATGEPMTDPATGELLGDDCWNIYSNDEVTDTGRTRDAEVDGKMVKVPVYQIDRGDGRTRELGEGSVVIRLWKSHPRKWVEADSPARALLPVLRELEGINQHVSATVDSRLAGAGLLLLPSELTFGEPPAAPQGPTTADGIPVEPASKSQSFADALALAMTAPIGDRGSAAAVVPLVAQAPGQYIGNAKFISFSTQFDGKTQELREADIRRLALGMNTPPEVLTGMADVNHWGAWQIDEASVKTHIEPTAETITAGLTERWLNLAIEAMGYTVNPARRINYETTELTQRPDRSDQAIVLYDRLELSGEALRRETGFDAGDKPEDDEVSRVLTQKLAMGSVPPQVAAAAQETITGISVDVSAPDMTGAPVDQAPPPADDAASPASPTPPDDQPEAQAAAAELPRAVAVLAAADQICARAVERAWNRLGNRGKTRRPLVPGPQLDSALAAEWGMVPRTANLLGVTAEFLEDACDVYSRGVLTTGAPHSVDALRQVLAAKAVEHGDVVTDA